MTEPTFEDKLDLFEHYVIQHVHACQRTAAVQSTATKMDEARAAILAAQVELIEALSKAHEPACMVLCELEQHTPECITRAKLLDPRAANYKHPNRVPQVWRKQP